MKPSAILEVLAGVTAPASVAMSEVSISVDATDAIAADLLRYAVGRWPDATVGQIEAGLVNAIFWQKLLYSLPSTEAVTGG